MAEAAPVVVGNARKGPEHVHGLGDEVVKVHSVGLAQALRVPLVHLGHGCSEGFIEVRVGRILIFIDELVLQRRNLVHDGLGRKLFWIQVQTLGHQRDQPQRVGRIVDGEIRIQPDRLCLAAQNPHA